MEGLSHETISAFWGFRRAARRGDPWLGLRAGRRHRRASRECTYDKQPASRCFEPAGRRADQTQSSSQAGRGSGYPADVSSCGARLQKVGQVTRAGRSESAPGIVERQKPLDSFSHFGLRTRRSLTSFMASDRCVAYACFRILAVFDVESCGMNVARPACWPAAPEFPALPCECDGLARRPCVCYCRFKGLSPEKGTIRRSFGCR